jgi:hypothetical protein
MGVRMEGYAERSRNLEWLAGHQRAGGSLRCVVPSELGPGPSEGVIFTWMQYFTLLNQTLNGSCGIRIPSIPTSIIDTMLRYDLHLRVSRPFHHGSLLTTRGLCQT